MFQVLIIIIIIIKICIKHILYKKMEIWPIWQGFKWKSNQICKPWWEKIWTIILDLIPCIIHKEARGNENKARGYKNQPNKTCKIHKKVWNQNPTWRHFQKQNSTPINCWRFTESEPTQSKLSYTLKCAVSVTYINPVIKILTLHSCILLKNHWYICDSREISKLVAIFNFIYMH